MPLAHLVQAVAVAHVHKFHRLEVAPHQFQLTRPNINKPLVLDFSSVKSAQSPRGDRLRYPGIMVPLKCLSQGTRAQVRLWTLGCLGSISLTECGIVGGCGWHRPIHIPGA